MTKYVIAGLLASLMTFGMVSSAAFASPTSNFAEADLDNDGHLTKTELETHGYKIKPTIFKYIDENSNGTIERGEFKWHYNLVKSSK
jgi:Ca2+-binding EF-hand superfamily protein